MANAPSELACDPVPDHFGALCGNWACIPASYAAER